MNRDRVKAFHVALKKVREPSQKAHTYALWATAIATFLLALGAFWNTWETRHLADLTMEQFSIKSYPAFLVEIESFKLNPEICHHRIVIWNKGEITAHNVTSLIVDAYKRDGGLDFNTVVSTYYESEERITTINFETKILRDTKATLTSESPYPEGYGPDSLQNCLLFVKFKVPYDMKYRYETFGFILKKSIKDKAEKTYIWQPISSTDTRSLVQQYIDLSKQWPNLLKEFFSGYDLQGTREEDKDKGPAKAN